MNPSVVDYVRYAIDQLFPPPTIMIILVIPIVIGLGLRLARSIVNLIQGSVAALPPESVDKPKREQPVSFFDPPDTEPDYVVGFGDDGELIYASEKPKRKNEELE